MVNLFAADYFVFFSVLETILENFVDGFSEMNRKVHSFS